MKFEIGKRLSHYQLVEKLGEGGMGVVFRAFDSRLRRDVAIKVMRDDRLRDRLARERFHHEALALSRVNHPNVVVIHDFSDSRRAAYIVMEYVPGSTLKEKLAPGPLCEDDVLSHGIQIADGLAAAHEGGVIHRDMKPGNIRLTGDARVKIVDFGLAKRMSGFGYDDTESTTLPGMVVGTLPYMAPEQLHRDTIDARTDVYALGAVLYQMACGQRPFPESKVEPLVHAITHEQPRSPRALNAEVSPSLESVILRALEKDPRHRYATAQDVAAALRELRARTMSGAVLVRASGPRPIRTIAVLPLADFSPGSDGDYFADGMTEAMIGDLSRLSGLVVRMRTSVMRFKGTSKSISEIARDLQVDAVLEGAVQRSGERVRTNVRLVRASTEEPIWGDMYDRKLTDILTLQSDIARSVARAIELQLKPREEAFLAKTQPIDPDAHELYLLGRYHWNRRDLEGLKAAIRYFEGAIAKSAHYALAYAGLADAYTVLGSWSVMAPRDVYPKAKEAARRALAIEPNLGEAHVALAFAEYLYDWRWEQAEKGFLRAIQLNPSYAPGHSWYANFLAAMRRHDESIVEARRSQELDPLSPMIAGVAAWARYVARRYDEAVQQCTRGVELNPNFPQTYLFLGLASTQLGRYEEAIAAYERGVSLSGGLTEIYAGLGYVYGVSGRTALARRVLEDLRELSTIRYVPPYSRAIVHIGLGERGEALELLEQSCEERNTWLVLLGVEPMFESIREEPRFQELLRIIGLP